MKEIPIPKDYDLIALDINEKRTLVFRSEFELWETKTRVEV